MSYYYSLDTNTFIIDSKLIVCLSLFAAGVFYMLEPRSQWIYHMSVFFTTTALVCLSLSRWHLSVCRNLLSLYISVTVFNHSGLVYCPSVCQPAPHQVPLFTSWLSTSCHTNWSVLCTSYSLMSPLTAAIVCTRGRRGCHLGHQEDKWKIQPRQSLCNYAKNILTIIIIYSFDERLTHRNPDISTRYSK